MLILSRKIDEKIKIGDDITKEDYLEYTQYRLDEYPKLDVDAPMYDLLGRQVGQDYRGIVIQNGRKYIRVYAKCLKNIMFS